ncbi:MAG: prepilin-type N-terminal cleavage/methylation domain-containing protein [Candidatus Omnitrophica bacterium]|nr:prepilin-type N-terminal cleavage/methylation domain-containing protein [Candidatus Omnitrophota bacterium]
MVKNLRSFLICKHAFTLAELLVVTIIISIMAAFAVPLFSKAINKAKARDAINNLVIIHAAQALIKANTSNFVTAGDLGTINSTLNLNLVASGAVYSCDAVSGTCTATLTSGGDVDLNLSSPINKIANLTCPPGGAANPCCTIVANCP